MFWIFSIPSQFPPDFSCIRCCWCRLWFWYVPNTNVKLSISFSFWTQWRCDVYMYRFLRFSPFFCCSHFYFLNQMLSPSSFQALFHLIIFSEGKWDLQQFPCIYSKTKCFCLGDPHHWPQSLSLTAVNRYTKWRRLVLNESFPLAIRDNTSGCSLMIKSHYRTLRRVQTSSITVQEQQSENLR